MRKFCNSQIQLDTTVYKLNDDGDNTDDDNGDVNNVTTALASNFSNRHMKQLVAIAP